MPLKIKRINKELFKKVFSSGKNVYSDFIFLKKLKIKEKNKFFSFVVSNKISKRAVVRNKIKKRARHITDKIAPSLIPGVAVAVFFKKGADKFDFREMEEKLISLYKRAEILQ